MRDGSAGVNDEIRDLSAVQRQFKNSLILDDLADACGPGFHESRIRLDFNLFADLSDFECGVSP